MLLESRVYAHNSRILQDIFLLLEEEMKCGRHNDLEKQNNEIRFSSLISSIDCVCADRINCRANFNQSTANLTQGNVKYNLTLSFDDHTKPKKQHWMVPPTVATQVAKQMLL